MSATNTTTRPNGLRKTREWLVIILFLTLLILPWVGQHAGLDTRWKLQENRPPAERPVFSWKWSDISLYPRRFEQYFNDAFGFRSLLTRCRSYMFYFWLHMSPSPNAIRGRDGRLFMGWREERESYQRLFPYQPEQIAQWAHYYDKIRSWLASRTCELVIMIPPNKSSLYPEYMPAMIKRAQAPSRADQLITALRKCGLTVIDPRESFAKAPVGAPLYYLRDTHWTPYGADIAWRDLLAVVYPNLPSPPPLPWERSTTKTYTADLVILSGLTGFLWEPQILTRQTEPPSLRRIPPLPEQPDCSGRRIVYETDAPDQKRAVMFHDSFAMSSFDDLLVANFSTLVMAWTYAFDPDIVRRHNPDVVIIEILERTLQNGDSFGNTVNILASMYGVEPAACRPHCVGENVVDNNSLLGAVRRAEEGSPPGWLLFGGYKSMSAGRYTARFRLRGEPISTGALAELDVSCEDGKRQLAFRTLNPGDLPAPNTWTDIDLPFEVLEHGAEKVEMRVNYHGGGRLDIESVSFTAQD